MADASVHVLGQPVSGRSRRRVARALCALFGLGWAIAAIALYARPPAVLAAWPWPEVGMSFVFLSSIAAAVAAVWLAIAIGGELAALGGVGINTAIVGAGVATVFALQGGRLATPQLAAGVAFGVASFAFGAWLWQRFRAVALEDRRPMPRYVRVAFVVFVAALLVAGIPMALQVPGIFPWDPQPASSSIFGVLFLGSAAYFGHAAARGQWSLAAPPLWGFLVYDLVLFAPYGGLFVAGPESVAGDYGEGGTINLTSLTIYLGVLAFSTLVALHAFFVARRPD